MQRVVYHRISHELLVFFWYMHTSLHNKPEKKKKKRENTERSTVNATYAQTHLVNFQFTDYGTADHGSDNYLHTKFPFTDCRLPTAVAVDLNVNLWPGTLKLLLKLR